MSRKGRVAAEANGWDSLSSHRHLRRPLQSKGFSQVEWNPEHYQQVGFPLAYFSSTVAMHLLLLLLEHRRRVHLAVPTGRLVRDK